MKLQLRSCLLHDAYARLISDSLVYFILLLFVVSRSDNSAENSLSVPQYSSVPFCYTDV